MRQMLGRVSRIPYLLVLAGSVAMFLALPACGGPLQFSRDIHEGQERFVRLEARYGGGDAGSPMRFAHPLKLDETAWVRIVSGIYVKPRRGLISMGTAQSGPLMAFHEAEIRYLAHYLSEAFRKARSDELVLFYLSRPRDVSIIEITSGGCVAERGRIHFLIANYRYAATSSFIPERIRKDPLWPAAEAFYELIPNRYQTVQVDRRWDFTTPLFAEISELVVDYKATLAASDEALVPEGLQGRVPAGKDEAGQLEDKLRGLLRLREQGLITEEEYRVKRQKLLEMF